MFEISTGANLQLLNLSGMALMHGVPTNIVRQSDQSNSQQLSLAIHGNAPAFDGIQYQSRFFGKCIAVYDHALHKLSVKQTELLENLEGSLRRSSKRWAFRSSAEPPILQHLSVPSLRSKDAIGQSGHGQIGIDRWEMQTSSGRRDFYLREVFGAGASELLSLARLHLHDRAILKGDHQQARVWIVSR